MEVPFSFKSGPSHSEVCATWWFHLHSASQFLAAKKAIINLKNEDDERFKWVITRALNPVGKNSERIDKKLREKLEVLNCDGLKFPVNLNDINKFENHNSSISVNVFGYENWFILLE